MSTPEDIAHDLDSIEQSIKAELDLDNEKTLSPDLLARLKKLSQELQDASGGFY